MNHSILALIVRRRCFDMVATTAAAAAAAAARMAAAVHALLALLLHCNSTPRFSPGSTGKTGDRSLGIILYPPRAHRVDE